jgi:DNA topoisomerase-2
MYVNSQIQAVAENSDGGAASKPNIVYEQVNDRWEVAFALSDGEPRHVSFANSISTSKGGTHVEMISTQLATKL